jgi:SagB-type dehydrogenase family enzyme
MTVIRAVLDHEHPPAFDIDAEDRDAMEIFHAQTCLDRRTAGRRGRIVDRFVSDPATIVASACLYQPELGDTVLPLPETPSPAVTFDALLRSRVSTRRDVLGGSVRLNDIAGVLSLSVRATREYRHPRADCRVALRAYPSAGSLYPCEVYLWPVATEGLAPRPYRYDAARHALVDYGRPDGDFRAVERCTDTDPQAVAIIVTGVLDRTVPKYGLRGYRFALLEAGHIGQSLVLAATALGLPSLVYGSYFENELAARLGVDGLNEVVLSVVLIGAGDVANHVCRED